MPPEWMPRWRGKCSTCRARSSTGWGMSWSACPAVDSHRAPAVDLLRPGVLLAGGVAEGLGHVAHRRLGPVGDDVGHLGRVLAAVALVDVLDDLFAAVALDVDVDVGRAVALGREEPLEQQAELHRVGLGDPEGEADRRVGRRAPALAEDVGPSAELDEVPHDQEVAGEAELLDEGQLVVDLGAGAGLPLGASGVRRPGPVAVEAALLGELAQPRHLVVARRARERRQVRGHQLRGRRRTRGRWPPPGRPHPGSGRSGGPARPPSAGGPRPRPAASRRSRRGCAGPAPRRGRWPAGGGPAWRSGRCWWPPRRPRPARPARPGRRCGPSRAGRRGPTARRPPARARTTSTSRASSWAAAAGPSASSAAGTAPLRHPVSTSQWWSPRTARSASSSRLVRGRALLALHLGPAGGPGQGA